MSSVQAAALEDIRKERINVRKILAQEVELEPGAVALAAMVYAHEYAQRRLVAEYRRRTYLQDFRERYWPIKEMYYEANLDARQVLVKACAWLVEEIERLDTQNSPLYMCRLCLERHLAAPGDPCP